MVMLSPFFAPRVMILSELLALASFSSLMTTMSDENPFAVLTNCAAGRAWSPSSGPTVVCLSAMNRSSRPVKIPMQAVIPGPTFPVYQDPVGSAARGNLRRRPPEPRSRADGARHPVGRGKVRVATERFRRGAVLPVARGAPPAPRRIGGVLRLDR